MPRLQRDMLFLLAMGWVSDDDFQVDLVPDLR